MIMSDLYRTIFYEYWCTQSKVVTDRTWDVLGDTALIMMMQN